MSFLKSMRAVGAVSSLLGSLLSAPVHAEPVAESPGAVTLQSHHWQLQAARTAEGTPETQWQSTRPIGLRFMEDAALVVDRLCNQMHGSYQTEGEQLKIGRMVSTMMACSDPQLMELEQSVAQQLPRAQRWTIAGNMDAAILTLTFEGGATWELSGQPTYETRYGPSERLFLEVAPQKVACSHPLMANAECLQVREVTYNDQGLRQRVGPWGNYYGTIEGYTHQPGVRHILRLKRYTNSRAPADTSRYLDVLDTVVESEIVR